MARKTRTAEAPAPRPPAPPRTKAELIEELGRILRDYLDNEARNLRHRVVNRYARLATLLESWDGPDGPLGAAVGLDATLDGENECRIAGHIRAASRAVRWFEELRHAEPAGLVSTLVDRNLRAHAAEPLHETRACGHFTRAVAMGTLDGLREGCRDIDSILTSYAAQIAEAPEARED